jgi:hypothetical protein
MCIHFSLITNMLLVYDLEMTSFEDILYEKIIKKLSIFPNQIRLLYLCDNNKTAVSFCIFACCNYKFGLSKDNYKKITK